MPGTWFAEESPPQGIALLPAGRDVLGAARTVLADFVESGAQPRDAGPVVLASLACSLESGGCPEVEAITAAWIARFQPDGSFGVHGGWGALALGLCCAAPFSELAARFHVRIRRAILERAAQQSWPRPARDWYDYDMVTGPAGALLALCADAEADADAMRPLADHLAALLASPDMSDFRISASRDDPQRSWNTGCVNLGLAHGVGGPVAALTAFVRRTGGAGSPYAAGLATGARWLMDQAHDDPRGLRTWAPRQRAPGSAPASRREAWCYGAPGIAWVVWDAGAALSSTELCGAAEAAFVRFVQGFDPDFHLDDDPAERLAICHGAAGLLLVADAFDRHAGNAAAPRLADGMTSLLEDQIPRITALGHADSSLLAGGYGIMASLLTRGGGDRTWLACLALR